MRIPAKRIAGGMVMAGGAVVLRPGSRATKAVCHQISRASRQLRYASGQLQGVRYRLQGRRPAPDVIDNVLADRIRSQLGSLEKRLDLPRVHVMVEDHVALLHGEVATQADAERIERAVDAVSGVGGVESYLHIGLGPGDSRPSVGRQAHPPSAALRRLNDAAVEAGTAPDAAAVVVRAVLASFADRLPSVERQQVAAHLPADVRGLFSPPRRARRASRVRTVHELVSQVTAGTEQLSSVRAERVTTAVIRVLRDLVPDEAGDVSAVLPAELRVLWQGETD